MADKASHVMNAHVTNFDIGAQSTVSVRWEFKRSDPFAISMCATVDDFGNTVEWVFSRSILSDALADTETDPVTGEGDVMMSADATDVVLYLSSPEGNAALIFERDQMEIFYADTLTIVPAQGEADALAADLDDFLNDVLGYAPPVTVDDTPRDVPTKELHFPMSGMTYTVPADSPADLAEWEAELLHNIYTEDDDTDTEE